MSWLQPRLGLGPVPCTIRYDIRSKVVLLSPLVQTLRMCGSDNVVGFVEETGMECGEWSRSYRKRGFITDRCSHAVPAQPISSDSELRYFSRLIGHSAVLLLWSLKRCFVRFLRACDVRVNSVTVSKQNLNNHFRTMTVLSWTSTIHHTSVSSPRTMCPFGMLSRR